MKKAGFRKPGLLAPLFVLAACSSAPKQAAAPEWPHQPARTVDNGYIVYVGSGEDRSPEKARFKAESMALQDLSNECTFAPKGTRIEDHYDETAGVLDRAYAKVAVSFEDCEAAQKATTPEEMRKLANAELTEQVKHYQELFDQPEPEEAAPVLVSNGPGATPPPPPISSGVAFFVVRQQIAFEKQYVILAPVTEYPPGVPQTMQPIRTVQVASQSVASYEQMHPEIRSASSTQAFSTSRPHWAQHQAAALRQSAAQRGYYRQNYSRATGQAPSPAPKKGGRGKKRRKSS